MGIILVSFIIAFFSYHDNSNIKEKCLTTIITTIILVMVISPFTILILGTVKTTPQEKVEVHKEYLMKFEDNTYYKIKNGKINFITKEGECGELNAENVTLKTVLKENQFPYIEINNYKAKPGKFLKFWMFFSEDLFAKETDYTLYMRQP